MTEVEESSLGVLELSISGDNWMDCFCKLQGEKWNYNEAVTLPAGYKDTLKLNNCATGLRRFWQELIESHKQKPVYCYTVLLHLV